MSERRLEGIIELPHSVLVDESVLGQRFPFHVNDDEVELWFPALPAGAADSWLGAVEQWIDLWAPHALSRDHAVTSSSGHFRDSSADPEQLTPILASGSGRD